MRWTKTRRRTTLAGIVAAMLVTAACGGSGDSDSNGGAEGTPQKGGSLTIAYQNEIQSLDPQATTSAAGAGSLPYYALYDALFTLNPETGGVDPKIGESLTADDSQKVWTLKLRPGVKFTDGTPYDAAAVASEWERAKGPTSAVASAASEIASTKVVDPTTLEITLVAPNSGFDVTVAQQLLFIASPTAVKKEGADFATNPVGAGPFKLTDWVRDSQKTFESNPDYYDGDKPYLDELVIKTIPDITQASTALKTGEVQLLYTQDGASTTKPLTDAGMQVTEVTTPGSPNFAFNNKVPPFDDANVRKAIALAVDSTEMANVTGTFLPTSTPFPEDSAFNFGQTWPAANPEEAQTLFDGYASSHGGEVAFTITAIQGANTVKEAEFLQTALNQFDNVKVDVKTEAPSTAIGNVFTGNFQVVTWGAPWYSPAGLYIYLHSGQQLNVYGYENPAVDKALDDARASGDTAEQDAQYQTVVEAMVTDMPFFNYGVRQAANVYASNVHGVKLFYDAYPFLEDIWVD